MAAETLATAGVSVTIYEAKPSPARKFLMAGKSGLNLTLSGDFNTLLSGYGDAAEVLRPVLQAFDNAALVAWAEGLDQPVFTGSTGRVFPKSMKASPLLRAWLARLDALGVTLLRRHRWTGWDKDAPVFETPDGPVRADADVTVLACGGASWARFGSDGVWAENLGIPITPFQPSNVGISMAWSEHMVKHFGSAIKSVAWHAGDTSSRGEAVLTQGGLEGGGVYGLSKAMRDGAALRVDLLPDRSVEQVANSVSRKARKATLSNWLRKSLHLSPVKVALVQEVAKFAQPRDPQGWAELLKALPLSGASLMDMDGAISTAGGVPFSALDAGLMLTDRPGVFCAGEMLDWEAPTGGWLLSACFATGAWAGRHAAQYLEAGSTH